MAPQPHDDDETFDGGDRRGDGRGPGRWLLVALFLGALVALLLYLFDRFPDAVSGSTDAALLVQYLAFAVVIGAAVLLGRRMRFGRMVSAAGLWIGLGFLLILAYSYRDSVEDAWNRVTGELLPSQGRVEGEGSVSFPRARDGHFYVEARVNGVPTLFVVDTGASDVVLTRAAAERAGYALEELHFNTPYNTANGVVFGANVRLDEIRIGPFVFRDVPASVNQSPMNESLMGIRLLERFERYEVRSGRLTLYR